MENERKEEKNERLNRERKNENKKKETKSGKQKKITKLNFSAEKFVVSKDKRKARKIRNKSINMTYFYNDPITRAIVPGFFKNAFRIFFRSSLPNIFPFFCSFPFSPFSFRSPYSSSLSPSFLLFSFLFHFLFLQFTDLCIHL